MLLELLPPHTMSTDHTATAVEWPSGTRSDRTRFATTLGWAQEELARPAVAARDLLRVAVAAYLADRGQRASSQLGRDLGLIVHVEDPDRWDEDTRTEFAYLLNWLTGDHWTLRCVSAPVTGGEGALEAGPAPTEVCLLSGGLDSLCGAAVLLRNGTDPFFLGHAETATSVRSSQRRLRTWLQAQEQPRDYKTLAFTPAASQRKNSTPRSRSFLYMALGVAQASGLRAKRVVVPENGYTSVNPPLLPSRGGAISTRSTHPWTFHCLARILGRLGLDDIGVLNPHAALTKGELLGQAFPERNDQQQALAAATISCAKLDGGRMGYNPNHHCGLCVACIVRRGAFLAAGLPDQTPYLVQETPDHGAKVRQRRRHDVTAVRSAVTRGLPRHRILANGMWPPDSDLTAVLDLVDRGLSELRRVSL